ncbi:hypothetical protein [Sphingopyxis sp. KK2]|uniref:hypothetical protein n=1 Tax=Sphingopyxis sp. KK2 TaxID=1855727 RepID=UPI001181B635|nr:hypothetical protein [Sphingopyxis sp. KK2]
MAAGFTLPPVSAQELKEIEISKVTVRGEFHPEAGKSYLMVESRNRRPLIRFVRLAEDTQDASNVFPLGYIEIPRDNRFANAADVSLWLFEVPAGNYAFSTISWQYLPQDIDCACMGSVRFTVEPEKVTAVRVESAILDAQGQQIETGNRANGRGEQDAFAMRGIAVGHPTSGQWKGRVAASAIEPARFVPMPELPNWFGNQINRVMPIPAVFRYERERMIDLRD